MKFKTVFEIYWFNKFVIFNLITYHHLRGVRNNLDGLITIANGSISSLYGCVGYAIQDLIMSKFPKDYFKYTSVSSELASRNIRRTFGTNSGIELAKRRKPYLIVQPTYSTMDPDGPLQRIPLTSNLDDLQYRVDKRYLFEVIRDIENGYALKFKLNRDRIDFDITVTVGTLHQQIDIYRSMVNHIIWEFPHIHRIALESVIPKQIIAIISKYCKMDLEEHEEYIPILLRRLNACSGYPITYKLRNASATDEWFMYYTHNVLVTFSDLNLESGNRKNMVDDSYNITFKVTAEFNFPGLYVIDGNVEKLKGIDIILKTKEYEEDRNTYIPLYTVNNLYSKFPQEANGMQLYGTTIFTSDAKPNQLEDRVDIKSVLDNDHMRVIRAHRAWNMNPDTLLTAYVLKNNELLTPDKDYHIDWNRLELVVKNPDKWSTYRLILYFNYITVNEILNNSAYENNYDVNELQDNTIKTEGLIDNKIELHSSVKDFKKDYNGMYYSEVVTEEQEASGAEVLNPDPDYPHGTNLEEVNPVAILEKNKIIIVNEAERVRHISDTIFPEGHVPDDKLNDPETVVVEEDPDYCGSNEIPLETFSLASIEPSITNADLHNEPVKSNTTKKFTSSI